MIVEENNSYEYSTTYKIKDENGETYRLFIEDYRNATFMYEKFHKAVINLIGKGQLQSVNVEDIKII